MLYPLNILTLQHSDFYPVLLNCELSRRRDIFLMTGSNGHMGNVALILRKIETMSSFYLICLHQSHSDVKYSFIHKKTASYPNIQKDICCQEIVGSIMIQERWVLFVTVYFKLRTKRNGTHTWNNKLRSLSFDLKGFCLSCFQQCNNRLMSRIVLLPQDEAYISIDVAFISKAVYIFSVFCDPRSFSFTLERREWSEGVQSANTQLEASKSDILDL